MSLQKKIHENEELAVGIVELVEQNNVTIKTVEGNFSLDVVAPKGKIEDFLHQGDQLTVVFDKTSKKPLELRDKTKHVLYIDEKYEAIHYTK